MYKRLFPLLLVPALASCASIVAGRFQTVNVETPDVQEAQCKLSNHKGAWAVPATPSPVLIHNSATDMVIVCEKAGYEKTTDHFASTVSPWLFGNILIGGIIGIIVDLSDGAGFVYDDKLIVAMKKAEPSPPAAQTPPPADTKDPSNKPQS
jgi:hypothetical protein